MWVTYTHSECMSLTLTHTHSECLSLTLTDTHSECVSLTLTHTHSECLSLTLTDTHSECVSVWVTDTHCECLSVWVTDTHCECLSLTLTVTHWDTCLTSNSPIDSWWLLVCAEVATETQYFHVWKVFLHNSQSLFTALPSTNRRTLSLLRYRSPPSTGHAPRCTYSSQRTTQQLYLGDHVHAHCVTGERREPQVQWTCNLLHLQTQHSGKPTTASATAHWHLSVTDNLITQLNANHRKHQRSMHYCLQATRWWAKNRTLWQHNTDIKQQ